KFHPRQITKVMMNNLATHDVPRIGAMFEGDPKLINMAYMILGTLPGILTNWQGDEFGMYDPTPGVSHLDPLNRKPVDWEKMEDGNPVFLGFKNLVELRKNHPALQSSNIDFIDTGDQNILAYLRYSDFGTEDNDYVFIAANRSKEDKYFTLSLTGHAGVQNIISGIFWKEGEETRRIHTKSGIWDIARDGRISGEVFIPTNGVLTLTPELLIEDFESAVRQEDWTYYSENLGNYLDRIAHGDRRARKELLSFLDNTGEIILREMSDFPVEANYPVLKAAALLNKKQRRILTDLLTKNAGKFKSQIADAILLMYEIYPEDWLELNAGELKGRKIYSVSPENLLVAGGLAYVQQVHERFMIDLGIDVVSIEPWYYTKMGEKGPEDIDYAAQYGLEDLKVIGETFVDVGSDKNIKVQFWSAKKRLESGKIKEIILLKELPERADGKKRNIRYTNMIYNYGKGKAKGENASWEEFSAFFARAASPFIKQMEEARFKEQGDSWQPAILWGNDSQSAGVLALLADEKDREESSPGIKGLEFAFTTHTFGNRQNFGLGDMKRIFGDLLGLRDKWWSASVLEKPDGSKMVDMASLATNMVDNAGGQVFTVSRKQKVVLDRDKTDPNARTKAVTNGDELTRAWNRIKVIYRSLYGRELEDADDLTPEQAKEIIQQGVRLLNLAFLEIAYDRDEKTGEYLDWFGETIKKPEYFYDSQTKKYTYIGEKDEIRKRKGKGLTYSETEIQAMGLGLDPEKPIVSYGGRLVVVKASPFRVFTERNIRRLVAQGKQVVIFGRIQGYKESTDLADMYRKIQEDIDQQKAKDPKKAAAWGKLVFKGSYFDEQKQVMLIASSLLALDSSDETGTCEWTEINGAIAMSWILASPWKILTPQHTVIDGEGIIAQANVKGEKGNLVIPDVSESLSRIEAEMDRRFWERKEIISAVEEAFFKAISGKLQEAIDKPGEFFAGVIRSAKAAQIVNGPNTSAAYLSSMSGNIRSIREQRAAMNDIVLKFSAELSGSDAREILDSGRPGKTGFEFKLSRIAGVNEHWTNLNPKADNGGLRAFLKLKNDLEGQIFDVAIEDFKTGRYVSYLSGLLEGTRGREEIIEWLEQLQHSPDLSWYKKFQIFNEFLSQFASSLEEKYRASQEISAAYSEQPMGIISALPELPEERPEWLPVSMEGKYSSWRGKYNVMRERHSQWVQRHPVLAAASENVFFQAALIGIPVVLGQLAGIPLPIMIPIISRLGLGSSRLFAKWHGSVYYDIHAPPVSMDKLKEEDPEAFKRAWRSLLILGIVQSAIFTVFSLLMPGIGIFIGLGASLLAHLGYNHAVVPVVNNLLPENKKIPLALARTARKKEQAPKTIKVLKEEIEYRSIDDLLGQLEELAVSETLRGPGVSGEYWQVIKDSLLQVPREYQGAVRYILKGLITDFEKTSSSEFKEDFKNNLRASAEQLLFIANSSNIADINRILSLLVYFSDTEAGRNISGILNLLRKDRTVSALERLSGVLHTAFYLNAVTGLNLSNFSYDPKDGLIITGRLARGALKKADAFVQEKAPEIKKDTLVTEKTRKDPLYYSAVIDEIRGMLREREVEEKTVREFEELVRDDRVDDEFFEAVYFLREHKGIAELIHRSYSCLKIGDPGAGAEIYKAYQRMNMGYEVMSLGLAVMDNRSQVVDIDVVAAYKDGKFYFYEVKSKAGKQGYDISKIDKVKKALSILKRGEISKNVAASIVWDQLLSNQKELISILREGTLEGKQIVTADGKTIVLETLSGVEKALYKLKGKNYEHLNSEISAIRPEVSGRTPGELTPEKKAALIKTAGLRSPPVKAVLVDKPAAEGLKRLVYSNALLSQLRSQAYLR
ncbi:MAG TPA: alpha-amylase family glycosyl hydrolase, partial [bacterium]|nr:alpha-amylase family glycosyl hydrolase [bacterium]